MTTALPLPEIWDISSPRISAVILQKKNGGHRLEEKAFERKLQGFECNIVCCFV